MQPLGTVGERTWTDRPVYVIGRGPSLEPWVEYLPKLKGKGYVLGVNSWKDVNPNLVFSLDYTWFNDNRYLIPTAPCPVLVALDDDHPRPEVPNLTYVRRVGRSPKKMALSEDPATLINLLNSGATALNVATLKGATELYLLGFDFLVGDQHQTHYDNRGEMVVPPSTRRMYPIWARILNDLAPWFKAHGVSVYNCSSSSLIVAYPHVPYEEALGT